MVDIIKKAISFVTEYQEPVRKTIRSIEINNYYNFFDELDGQCFVSDKEVYKYLGTSRSNATTKLRKLGVNVQKDKKTKRNFFLAEELQNRTSSIAKDDISELWSELKRMTTATSLSQMLFITQHQREHNIKTANLWDFRLIGHTQYHDFMTGRKTSRGEVKSIFERKNLLINGKPFTVTSHQFRHFLNTICQLHDGITELEIARYFGRNYQGDNQAYDHTNKSKLVMDNAKLILASNGITEDQAIEAMVNFTLVDSEEALEAIQDLTTTLVTAIGLCKHDFAEKPCGRHYACLRGCSSYKRIKGEDSEVRELERIIQQEEKHIADAKNAVAEKFWGANHWLQSHQKLHDGCKKALAIESNNDFSVGEVIQVFPDGDDSCLAIDDLEQKELLS